MNSSVPSDLLQLQAQFESWRRTRTSPRQPIPVHLRQAAIALLDRYSASIIARHCRIHYRILKPLVASHSKEKARPRTVKKIIAESAPAAPSFFHLLAAPSPSAADCRLMLDRPDGARLIQHSVLLYNGLHDQASFAQNWRKLSGSHAARVETSSASSSRG